MEGKNLGLPAVYAVAAGISLLLMICYCWTIRKKEVWFFLLFTSVFIVNSGYFALTISGALEEALLANRLSYLGSVFLPVSMMMIILGACRLSYRKWVPIVLLCLAGAVFFVAASPGYLDIYYKEVHLVFVDGVAVLKKVYGPWHKLYLFYLLGLFGAMLAVIVCSARKRCSSARHVVVLVISVFVNIIVWLLEQLVQINFEFLSISYIITELFLLGLYWMLQEEVPAPTPEKVESPEEISLPEGSIPEELPEQQDSVDGERIRLFAQCVQSLTPTEKTIYDLYLAGRGTREVMAELHITENTLKFHNKNIYGKMSVSSRKQLLQLARELEQR